MDKQSTAVLSLDQAYQAAFLWLDHVGEPPQDISEPAHGSVQLESEHLFTRVRWDERPVEQSAILAALKVAPEEKRIVLFSASGYSPGAVSIAETQGIALYSFDRFGAATGDTTHARSLAPDDAPHPPFAPPPAEEDDDDFWARPKKRPVEEPDPDVPLIDAAADDWADCPTCGTTHFRSAAFCRECGTHIASGVKHSRNATAADLGLRCRTCEGTDIEIGAGLAHDHD